MEDHQIVELYWRRDEQAIPATAEKYGSYCAAIARNILGSREDTEECLNDTYLRAWNAMPPQRPTVLSVFLGKITRNLCLNRCRNAAAAKRGGGQAPLALDELAECVSGRESVESEQERQELIEAINAFLGALPAEKRGMFLCRYWYFRSIAQIAEQYGRTEGSVTVLLSRLRKQLKHHLEEGGFVL